MGYTEVGSLTPFCGGQTTKVAVAGGLTMLYGGQTTRGSLSPIYFHFSIETIFFQYLFFDASVVIQNTLSFSRITRALSN
jgi:hypothetical protein